MAGFFERLVGSRIRAKQCSPMDMELQTAKEILAEVFGVRVSEVDEMILSRFEDVRNEDSILEENVPWPQELRLEE